MKQLIDYISNDNMLDESTETPEVYKELITDYIRLFGNGDFEAGKAAIVAAANAACAEVNKVINILAQNNILFVTRGQFVGRVFETCFGGNKKQGNHFLNINGFNFHQGIENSAEKDFECDMAPKNQFTDEFNEKWSQFAPNAHSLGIELKCFQGSRPVGNKSYANDADDGLKGSKSSFYMLIGYRPVKDAEGNLTNVSIKALQMVYLLQSDWVGAAKGNSASLKTTTSAKMITLI